MEGINNVIRKITLFFSVFCVSLFSAFAQEPSLALLFKNIGQELVGIFSSATATAGILILATAIAIFVFYSGIFNVTANRYPHLSFFKGKVGGFFALALTLITLSTFLYGKSASQIISWYGSLGWGIGTILLAVFVLGFAIFWFKKGKDEMKWTVRWGILLLGIWLFSSLVNTGLGGSGNKTIVYLLGRLAWIGYICLIVSICFFIASLFGTGFMDMKYEKWSESIRGRGGDTFRNLVSNLKNILIRAQKNINKDIKNLMEGGRNNEIIERNSVIIGDMRSLINLVKTIVGELSIEVEHSSYDTIRKAGLYAGVGTGKMQDILDAIRRNATEISSLAGVIIQKCESENEYLKGEVEPRMEDYNEKKKLIIQLSQLCNVVLGKWEKFENKVFKEEIKKEKEEKEEKKEEVKKEGGKEYERQVWEQQPYASGGEVKEAEVVPPNEARRVVPMLPEGQVRKGLPEGKKIITPAPPIRIDFSGIVNPKIGDMLNSGYYYVKFIVNVNRPYGTFPTMKIPKSGIVEVPSDLIYWKKKLYEFGEKSTGIVFIAGRGDEVLDYSERAPKVFYRENVIGLVRLVYPNLSYDKRSIRLLKKLPKGFKVMVDDINKKIKDEMKKQGR